MGKNKEIERFEDRFSSEVIEIDAVTGASGFGAGKGGKNILWSASIELIAWKIHGSNNEVINEKYELESLVDDEGLKKLRDLIKKESIIRVKVSVSKDSSMKYLKLVEVINNAYEDKELEEVLQESLKPVFYEDEILGKMELNKRINTFETKVDWVDSTVFISFDNDDSIKDYVSTAHELCNNKDDWNEKIISFAAEELLELANDWYAESREEYYESFDPDFEEEDEYFKYETITKERFMELIEIQDIIASSDGEFTVYCSDGDIFLGHSIIVSGNINGEFDDAQMAG